MDKVAVDKSTNAPFDWKVQLVTFRRQMEMAARLQRPVSVHSVHSHGFLLEYFLQLDKDCASFAKRNEPLPCAPSIMLHSFAASKEIMKALIQLPRIGSRFYFSYSHIVNSRAGKKTLDKIAATPDDRLLIESDVHCVTQVDSAMEKVVEMVGEAKKWRASDVIEKTGKNALVYLRRIL